MAYSSSISTLAPADTKHEIGISLLNTRLLSQGTFGQSRGAWLLSLRRGWERGGPGIANLLGVMPIAIGIAGLAWTMVAAFRHIPDRMELRLPAFLMTRGPYSYSRNPMYASELVLWLGWAAFYGSVAVLIVLVAFFAVLVVAVRYEERRE